MPSKQPDRDAAQPRRRRPGARAKTVTAGYPRSIANPPPGSPLRAACEAISQSRKFLSEAPEVALRKAAMSIVDVEIAQLEAAIERRTRGGPTPKRSPYKRRVVRTGKFEPIAATLVVYHVLSNTAGLPDSLIRIEDCRRTASKFGISARDVHRAVLVFMATLGRHVLESAFQAEQGSPPRLDAAKNTVALLRAASGWLVEVWHLLNVDKDAL